MMRESRPNSSSRVAGEEPRNKMRIEACAPTRIDLAGGTLDIWPLYLFHQPAVTLNCAISLYASCTLQTERNSKAVTLISRDTHRREQFASLQQLKRARRVRLPLLAEFVKFFSPPMGLTITTDSEAPAGAGISGSSALAVALSAAFDRLAGSRRRREDWIHLSRDVEAIVLGVPTGTQDHYPAAFGGVSEIQLTPGEEFRSAARVNIGELEKRIVLCYTGKPRKSGINNWKVFRSHIEGNRRVWRNLEQIAQIACEMAGRLAFGDWNEVGRLMREEWSFRRRNLPTISTPMIDRIIAGALRSGALGGKVCGAGGGGCVALLIEDGARKRVEAIAAREGGQILPVRIDRRGVRVQVVH
jgi:D-glycero-alpha-D-manno-heptose-7-phosphate kinase